jgi:hypothetical protein
MGPQVKAVGGIGETRVAVGAFQTQDGVFVEKISPVGQSGRPFRLGIFQERVDAFQQRAGSFD